MIITFDLLREIEREICLRRENDSRRAREDALRTLIANADMDVAYRAGVCDVLECFRAALMAEAKPVCDEEAPATPVRWEAD